MGLRRRTINELAEMICGEVNYFHYRSSTYLSEFFADCGFHEHVHDGSTRKWWVAETLSIILPTEPNAYDFPSEELTTIIQSLMDKVDATGEDENRSNALGKLNASLARDSLKAYYDEDGVCKLQNTKSNASSTSIHPPRRAWTSDEINKRNELIQYLDTASEDNIIEEILLPLFQQLGFQRITAEGHRERILEYGKDVWMKYRLPTLHYLYFGIQVKKGKVDAAGRSKGTNIADIHNQVLMMLGHEIFDPETNKTSLVDHAFIITGGEITRQAKNWLGGKLDASQRSQILFMDRDDILDLMLRHKIPIPTPIEVA